jgi:hypothetical protein
MMISKRAGYVGIIPYTIHERAVGPESTGKQTLDIMSLAS